MWHCLFQSVASFTVYKMHCCHRPRCRNHACMQPLVTELQLSCTDAQFINCKHLQACLQAKRNDADLAGRPANDHQFRGCILRDLRACLPNRRLQNRQTDRFRAVYRLYMHHASLQRPQTLYSNIYHIVKSKWQRSFKRIRIRACMADYMLLAYKFYSPSCISSRNTINWTAAARSIYPHACGSRQPHATVTSSPTHHLAMKEFYLPCNIGLRPILKWYECDTFQLKSDRFYPRDATRPPNTCPIDCMSSVTNLAKNTLYRSKSLLAAYIRNPWKFDTFDSNHTIFAGPGHEISLFRTAPRTLTTVTIRQCKSPISLVYKLFHHGYNRSMPCILNTRLQTTSRAMTVNNQTYLWPRPLEYTPSPIRFFHVSPHQNHSVSNKLIIAYSFQVVFTTPFHKTCNRKRYVSTSIPTTLPAHSHRL